MYQKVLIAFILSLLYLSSHLRAEPVDSATFKLFMSHIHKSIEYEVNSDFVKCFEEIENAKEIARSNNDEELIVRVAIFEAEVCRKTRDFHKGIEILNSISISEKYPALHIKKLGRMAAILNEGQFGFTDVEKVDTIKGYLTKAIEMAQNLDLKEDLAGLYNELGFLITHTNTGDTSRIYIRKAAQLYLKLNDTVNFIGCKINLMRSYLFESQFEKVDALFKQLLNLTERKGQTISTQEVYKIRSAYYKYQGDSLNAKTWRTKAFKKKLDYVQDISLEQLDAYRIRYETNKYQQKAIEKEEQLQQEAETKRTILIFLFILAVLIVGVGFLLFREHNLKAAVDKANEKYHMLLVESNHRIKNNLQMVISMLEYASVGLEERDSMAFKRMSGKIQTISALHKHLYLDVHNEKVDLNTFFKDIIKMYKEISSRPFTIHSHVENVKIESERIVYFGLIFNEMLSNTIEHGNLENPIFISVKKVNSEFRFSYKDDSNFTIDEANIGTGTQLIKQLIGRVEGYNFEMKNKVGRYTFNFHE